MTVLEAKPSGMGVIKPPDDITVISGEYIDPEILKRAWRAVTEFRRMMPQMRAFVRAITRNPEMNAELTTGTPCTDGKTVWLRAPIALGDRLDHSRVLCGQRDDDTMQQLCAACARSEEIMTTMIHECAHKVFDSFESLSEADRADIIRRVLFERPGISGTRLDKLQKGFNSLPDPTYVSVNGLISPYLPVIFNALEDARVNRMMYTARAGTKVWFQASTIKVFSEGIERDDGTIARWSEMGRNSQIVIGLYCRASGFATAGWFDPEVEEALADKELTDQLVRLTTARTAASVYRAGFPILEILRKRGFCKRLGEPEDDPPPPPPPPPEGESCDEGGSGSYATPTDSKGTSEPSKPSIVPEEDSAVLAPEDMFDAPASEEDDDGSEPTADDDEEGTDGLGDTDDDGDEEADDDEHHGGGKEAEDDDESDERPEDGYGLDDDETEPEDDDLGGAEDSESDPDEEDDSEGGKSASGEDDADAGEDADDVGAALAKFGGHATIPTTHEQATEDKAVDRAVVQAEDFDTPSGNILGVKVHLWNEQTVRSMRLCWKTRDSYAYKDAELDPPESIMGRCVMKARIVFAYNKASKNMHGLRHGRLHTPHAWRTATGEKEVFARTKIPGKRNYKVLIGLDCSGSTHGRRNVVIKQAGMAMCELLSRTGVDFAAYGHTGFYADTGASYGLDGDLVYWVDQFQCKSFAEPWGPNQKNALKALQGAQCNLDGHSLEFYRKLIQAERATDKLIVYFSDGEMPAENYEDELVVLQREIEMCRRLGIALLGVGINCDSPKKHGLDTVRIDGVEDIPKLLAEIETRLIKVRV